jgi:acetyltransferase-like isoleucine patch superfamily enzyme
MIERLKIKFYVFLNLLILNWRGVSFEEKLRIRGPILLKLGKHAKLNIGSNFDLTSALMLNPIGRNIKSSIRVDDNASLTIGNNVGMSNVCIWVKTSIIVGDNIKIGADCIIIDSDMHSLNYRDRRNHNTDSINAKSAPIIIENDCFIGTRSIITKGVTIGSRSIVAAGSVVTKSIPPNEIWGGNPVSFIKRIPNDEK